MKCETAARYFAIHEIRVITQPSILNIIIN